MYGSAYQISEASFADLQNTITYVAISNWHKRVVFHNRIELYYNGNVHVRTDQKLLFFESKNGLFFFDVLEESHEWTMKCGWFPWTSKRVNRLLGFDNNINSIWWYITKWEMMLFRLSSCFRCCFSFTSIAWHALTLTTAAGDDEQQLSADFLRYLESTLYHTVAILFILRFLKKICFFSNVSS